MGEIGELSLSSSLQFVPVSSCFFFCGPSRAPELEGRVTIQEKESILKNQNQDVNMTLLLVNIAYGLDHGGGDSSWQRPDEGGRVKLRISDGRSGSPVI